MTKEELSLMIENYKKQAESNKTKRLVTMFIVVSVAIFLIMFLVARLDFVISLFCSAFCSLIYLYTGSLVFTYLFLKSEEENKELEDLKKLYKKQFGDDYYVL